MSYMDQNVAFAPAGGIQELSFDEVALISAGKKQGENREDTGCSIFGNLFGGTLGAIAGVAVTSVAGPGWGIAAGIYFGGMSSPAAQAWCHSWGGTNDGDNKGGGSNPNVKPK
jgi:hypothetical protein